MPNRHLATCFLRFSLLSNDWQLLGLLSFFIYMRSLSFLLQRFHTPPFPLLFVFTILLLFLSRSTVTQAVPFCLCLTHFTNQKNSTLRCRDTNR